MVHRRATHRPRPRCSVAHRHGSSWGPELPHDCPESADSPSSRSTRATDPVDADGLRQVYAGGQELAALHGVGHAPGGRHGLRQRRLAARQVVPIISMAALTGGSSYLGGTSPHAPRHLVNSPARSAKRCRHVCTVRSEAPF